MEMENMQLKDTVSNYGLENQQLKETMSNYGLENQQLKEKVSNFEAKLEFLMNRQTQLEQMMHQSRPDYLETARLNSRVGQAKVFGTVVCVGGAMLLSFYHGGTIGIGESHIHWKLADGISKASASKEGNFILGPFLVITSCVAWAGWFIIQARVSEKFTTPYTSSTIMCFMASIRFLVVGAYTECDLSAWSLSSGIRLVASLYAVSLAKTKMQRRFPFFPPTGNQCIRSHL
ncbi:WAT1-related protein At1g09380-like [Malania oleifera]|uniref:WAT1-related protein At1g09380-like n=1 Tax=Malania oleifera TaxID=397392 RepID=UPI0025ADD78B|nr:WAT1-related protein At1g09380-like [Malania oleifera]